MKRKFWKILRFLPKECTNVFLPFSEILRRFPRTFQRCFDYKPIPFSLSRANIEANLKISISSLFTVKIKLIFSYVSWYDFSAMGEIFGFHWSLYNKLHYDYLLTKYMRTYQMMHCLVSMFDLGRNETIVSAHCRWGLGWNRFVISHLTSCEILRLARSSGSQIYPYQ